MSDLVHITTHEDDAVARLIGQYQDRPRLAAIVRAIVKQIQEIEDALWDVYVQGALDAAANAELDVIGDIVGQERSGLDDTNYRVFISARIKTNRSDGKYSQLMTVAKLLLGADAKVKFRAYYPSAAVMASDDVAINTLIVWRDFLRRAKGAGGALQFGYSKQPSSNTIKLGSFYAGNVQGTTNRIGSTYSPTYGGGETAGIYG